MKILTSKDKIKLSDLNSDDACHIIDHKLNLAMIIIRRFPMSEANRVLIASRRTYSIFDCVDIESRRPIFTLDLGHKTIRDDLLVKIIASK
jgi:hypothetical protein